MTWDQWLILTGVGTIWLALSERLLLRSFAPWLGLLGEVGWFVAISPRQQPGMFIAAIAYTLVYAHAIHRMWFRERRTDGRDKT